jgi:hypothetical protein
MNKNLDIVNNIKIYMDFQIFISDFKYECFSTINSLNVADFNENNSITIFIFIKIFHQFNLI